MAHPYREELKVKNISAADILLVGTGIMGTMQMTLEANELLKTRDIVFILHYDNSVYQYVKNMGIEVVDASLFYENGSFRTNVYQDISYAILEAAQTKKVAFLVHGHPLFIVSTSEFLLEKADEYNLSVEVIPSVSSLDTIIADLKFDLGYALQSYEANYMLSMKPNIDNRFPLLIFQVAILGQTEVNKAYKNINLTPLKDFLLHYYPNDQKMVFILSSKHAILSGNKLELSLENLDKIEVDFLEGRPTLFIPPIGEEKIDERA